MGVVERLVTLRESETIVPRGHRKVVWFVRVGERWESVAERHPELTTPVDPGPGTVWERVLDFPAAPGTLLMRVESVPAPEAPREVLDYLRRETRGVARKVRRQVFTVTARGELEASDVPPRRCGTPE